jgi:hypothetical protein
METAVHVGIREGYEELVVHTFAGFFGGIDLVDLKQMGFSRMKDFTI